MDRRCYLLETAPEIICHIASYTSQRDRLNLEQTCTKLRNALRGPHYAGKLELRHVKLSNIEALKALLVRYPGAIIPHIGDDIHVGHNLQTRRTLKLREITDLLHGENRPPHTNRICTLDISRSLSSVILDTALTASSLRIHPMGGVSYSFYTASSEKEIASRLTEPLRLIFEEISIMGNLQILKLGQIITPRLNACSHTQLLNTCTAHLLFILSSLKLKQLHIQGYPFTKNVLLYLATKYIQLEALSIGFSYSDYYQAENVRTLFYEHDIFKNIESFNLSCLSYFSIDQNLRIKDSHGEISIYAQFTKRLLAINYSSLKEIHIGILDPHETHILRQSLLKSIQLTKIEKIMGFLLLEASTEDLLLFLNRAHSVRELEIRITSILELRQPLPQDIPWVQYISALQHILANIGNTPLAISLKCIRVGAFFPKSAYQELIHMGKSVHIAEHIAEHEHSEIHTDIVSESV